jgi:hypothetical protein
MQKFKVLCIAAVILTTSGVNFPPQSASAWSPVMESAAFVDFDHNGTIDRVKVVWNGNVTSCKFDAGDWVIGPGSVGLTGPTGRVAGYGSDGNCDGTQNYFYLLVSGNTGETGYPGTFVPADIDYTNQGAMDDITVLGMPASNQSLINIDDNASPVIVSSSPSAGATGVSVTTSSVRVTFSEPMLTAATSMSISAGSWGPSVWTDEGKTLTRSRLLTLPYDTTITVTLTGEDKAGYLISSGNPPAITNPWAFRTTTDPASTVSASQSTVSASPTSVVANNIDYSTITVTVRNASGSPLSGKTVTLSSSRGSTDIISFINIVTNASGQAIFRAESGTAGTSIFTAVVDGVTISSTAAVTFTSSTPTPGPVSASRSSVSASPASVVANDSDYSNITVTVRDSSDNLLSGKTVVLLSNRTSDTVASLPGGSITNFAGQATFQVRSDTAGTSIFTAIVDSVTITQTATVVFTAITSPPSGLVYGDLFKEGGSTAVYYYGTDGKRHVFPTQAIYLSWYSGFSGIKTVSHETVTLVPLGGNVIAKPGTYLIQFVSMDTPFRVLDPKIYALTENGQLRWVTSASAATSLYGADWEKKIIAVPEVFRTNYIEGGTNINSASDYSKASVEALARTISDTIR